MFCLIFTGMLGRIRFGGLSYLHNRDLGETLVSTYREWSAE